MVGFPSLSLAVGMRPLHGRLLYHLFFFFFLIFLLLGLNSSEKHHPRALSEVWVRGRDRESTCSCEEFRCWSSVASGCAVAQTAAILGSVRTRAVGAGRGVFVGSAGLCHAAGAEHESRAGESRQGGRCGGLAVGALTGGTALAKHPQGSREGAPAPGTAIAVLISTAEHQNC